MTPPCFRFLSRLGSAALGLVIACTSGSSRPDDDDTSGSRSQETTGAGATTGAGGSVPSGPFHLVVDRAELMPDLEQWPPPAAGNIFVVVSVSLHNESLEASLSMALTSFALQTGG